ncbi:Piso0_003627 [Millerozyma farinosa CBS 7064]|uniref:Piso0_003627 protein n=1 Tax=Pichia sorbitophila (strain ATCC MYA-4447 / BCRC 22081 / CBS 7064 / NBRC 10061 / NRRL Y-12695) TaxID=559304 RepID=G8YJL5_PICSO|nr:Piso0_003627 [Millerozyma farinosa CBS 7064]CCE81275.1 Piso0_003627 [Millerozyma farinosa CBS 7064]
MTQKIEASPCSGTEDKCRYTPGDTVADLSPMGSDRLASCDSLIFQEDYHSNKVVGNRSMSDINTRNNNHDNEPTQADTQVIEKTPLLPTKHENLSLNNLSLQTPSSLKVKQMPNTSPLFSYNTKSLKNEDDATQKISEAQDKYISEISYEEDGSTQPIAYPDHKLNADTQMILSPEKQNDSFLEHLNANTSYSEQKDNETQLIEGTTEKTIIPTIETRPSKQYNNTTTGSRTQVFDSQEIMATDSKKIELNYRSAIYSSSQGSEEAIRTDDDQFQDSESRNACIHDEFIPSKGTKRHSDEMEDSNIIETSPPENVKKPKMRDDLKLFNSKSKYLALRKRSPNGKLITSSSQVDESSPNIKNHDLLDKVASSSKKAPTNTPIRTNEFISKATSFNFPSSPTNNFLMRQGNETSNTFNDRRSQPKDPSERNEMSVLLSDNNTVEDFPTTLRQEEFSRIDEDAVNLRDRVWVSFDFNIYVGQVVNYGSQESVVSFEEGEYVINNSDLHLLDIRIGDSVRLRNSKYKFKVTGLTYQCNGSKYLCARGFNYVYLQRLTKRKKSNLKEIGVDLQRCYMELSDWAWHKQNYELIIKGMDVLKSSEDLHYGIIRDSIGDKAISQGADTIKKSRASGLSITPESSPSKRSQSKRSPKKLDTEKGKSQLFSGMIFCITSGKQLDEEVKENVVDAIKENGGSVIYTSFIDILEFSCGKEGNLKLISDTLNSFVFGAVISNSYCRSAKYLQALCLGWPVLSVNFILDSISYSKVLDWQTYLLPAGYSHKIQSIKSLNVFAFATNRAQGKALSDQLMNNNHLLHDYHIIMSHDDNSTTIRTCEFIFHAFGARDINMYSNYHDLVEILESFTGEVMIYDNSKNIRSIIESYSQNESVSTLPNRENVNSKANKKKLRSKRLHFIDWEWVVQCVISNYIWETQTFTVHY